VSIRTQSSLLCAVAAGLLTAIAAAQTDGPLRIDKVDPPNWYATLPKPMLLVRGEGFGGAQFSLSDHSLQIERTQTSENGHWAQLWLSASPSAPETVQLQVQRGSAHAEQAYHFEQRRAAADGMAGFTASDVMYLILTDRFADGDLSNDGPLARDSASSPAAAAERAKPRGWHGGDLRGIAQHLDYLQQAGATAVWTTPVYQNHAPEAYHGYHTTDYYAVDEHYGTMADLQSLASALHARGMKLVLDTVPNHVGPLHPWVTDEPAPDWFHGTLAHHIAGESNFDALINPHAPQRDREATLDGWFVDSLPDMNTGSPAVAQYLRQNVVWWIEQTGADALRIDTFPYVDRLFWHEYMAQLKALYPHLTEVGEVSNGDPEITSAFADGVRRAGVDTGLYTPFDFPLFYATREVFGKAAPFTRITRVLEADELYPHPDRLVTFLGNHDNARLAHAIPDAAQARLAFAFLMTTRGMPQIYAGDEIGMTGGDDPDNRRDFPGGFPGAKVDAFTAARRTPEQTKMFDWVHQLSTLRSGSRTLACGAEQILQTAPNSIVYARYGNSGCSVSDANGGDQRPMLVLIERGKLDTLQIDLHATAVAGCNPGKLVMGEGVATMKDGKLTVTPATNFVVVPCE
jgi:neopullulanase